ncbi:MAG: NifB/NifX family molybdenum-iron cluster-binding protein [Bacteroidales bacterium]
MKTAIASTGNTLDSKVDSRFGRCAFFVIHDSETGSTEYIPNPHKNDEGGAGPAAVQLISAKGAKQIVSGEFGIKIKSLLDSQGVQMILMQNEGKSISEIIDLLNHKNQK